MEMSSFFIFRPCLKRYLKHSSTFICQDLENYLAYATFALTSRRTECSLQVEYFIIRNPLKKILL